MFNSRQKFTPQLGHHIALYVRSASGNESAISEQTKNLNAFVDKQNLDSNFGWVVKVFSDNPGSGMDFKRPGLTALLDSVERRELDLIIVTDLLRLTRSSQNFWKILKTLFVNGCDLQSLQENFRLFENEKLCDALNMEVGFKFREVHHA